MRCFLLKVQWSLRLTVALFESHTRTSVGKICDRCWSSSSMSDDSSFDEVSVWCFARVEWYWSQSVYGLQAVTVATSNSLFPFPMWCSWAGAYTILVCFEMTHRWNPYQRCCHRLFLSSFECCGWLPKHCTALSCTICPVICLNVVSLTKHSGWIVVFPIHDHSWKQQTSQHQPGQPCLASCWSVAVCSASALTRLSQCMGRRCRPPW